MRYVTVRVVPTTDEGLHPLMAELAAEPAVTREAIHRVDALADGTCAMLGEARGDQARFEAIMADSDYVRDFTVTGADGRWYSYSNFEPTAITERFLATQADAPGLVETPIVPRSDGAIEVTLVGEAGSLADAVPPAGEGYRVELLETGDRPPRGETLFACLTERQRTVLAAALECGYYEQPREATQADVAGAVGCSPSTAGEHLRKVESRVFRQFTR